MKSLIGIVTGLLIAVMSAPAFATVPNRFDTIETSTGVIQGNIDTEESARIAVDAAIAVDTTTNSSNIAGLFISTATNAADILGKVSRTGDTGMTGNYTTTGNITANLLFGDGSNLTGIAAGISTSDNLNWTGIHTFNSSTTFKDVIGTQYITMYGGTTDPVAASAAFIESWGTLTGGYVAPTTARGMGSIDLQFIRTAGTQVASGQASLLLGGQQNTATGLGSIIIGAGESSNVGEAAAILGGSHNSITDANSLYPIILGGAYNSIDGSYSTVIGGYNSDIVGDYSAVFGRRAKANASGVVVLTDSQDAEYSVAVANTFGARFSGGYLLTGGEVIVSSDVTAAKFHGDGSSLTGITYTETDPVYIADPAFGITSGDITNWDTAFGWGDHSGEGYLTTVAAVDITAGSLGADVIASSIAVGAVQDASIVGMTSSKLSGALPAIDGSNLTGITYTESDPVFTAHDAAAVTSAKITNWDTAFGWGDHSGLYATTADLSVKVSSALASGSIFVGNGTGVATGVVMSGDMVISNTGVISFNGSPIVNADINAGAAIVTSKLSGAVTDIASHGLGALATLSAVSGGSGGTITDATITNADIHATAGIAGSKVTLTSLTQEISTSGDVKVGAGTAQVFRCIDGTMDGMLTTVFGQCDGTYATTKLFVE